MLGILQWNGPVCLLVDHPTLLPMSPPGATGAAYMRFVVNSLKPFIDRTHRTSFVCVCVSSDRYIACGARGPTDTDEKHADLS